MTVRPPFSRRKSFEMGGRTVSIWGGRRLHDDFGYDTPSDHTGECWAVSAHPDGEGSVCGGTYDGTPLSVLWKEHPELFGNLPLDRFPLLGQIKDVTLDSNFDCPETAVAITSYLSQK